MADDQITLAHREHPGFRWTIPAVMLPVHEDTGWVPVDEMDWDDADDDRIYIEPPPDPAPPDEAHEGPEVPAGNASREAWASYAASQGAFEEDLADLTRDEIRDLYTKEN